MQETQFTGGMQLLRDLIMRISSEYSLARTQPYGAHPLANYIRNEAPNLIREQIPVLYRDYKIEGSAGRGGWSETSWVAVFNPEVTERASEGYYPVYLFPSKSERIILGLAQSYEEAKARYGKESDIALTKQAELMRMKIPE